MELDKMKTLWDEMSLEVEKQKKLTDKIIMDMTQERYKNKFTKISTYETIGAVICFIAAVAILVNFNKLDTWYLMLCGIFSILYLFVLPIAVLRSISQIKAINITENTYKKTLLNFTKHKKQMLFIQQLGIYINFIFLIFFFPVAQKLLTNKDIFTYNNNAWSWQIPVISIAIIAMILMSRWGYKCYKNIAKSAEITLKELE